MTSLSVGRICLCQSDALVSDTLVKIREEAPDEHFHVELLESCTIGTVGERIDVPADALRPTLIDRF